MSQLILPRKIEKALVDEGKAKISGLSPWSEAINGRSVKGAAIKKGNWRDYYDMYRQHSIVRSAIDTIALNATAAGFDFVPRDSRAKIRDDEVAVLKTFFSGQSDFIGELSQIYRDMFIYGDAYLYIVPDRRRKPKLLKRIHPKTIHIKVSKNGNIEAYYQKDPDRLDDDVVAFRPHEILHFKFPDPDNDIYGLSPLESLKHAVAADLYAQRYNASFFANSGVTGTIIGIRNANPDEIQRNRVWLNENYTGPEAAHKPIVVEGESIEIKKSVATHQEMGFLEGRRFIIMEILAVLGVPPVKIGILESANRSNSKEQDKTFRTEHVAPLQNIVQNVINNFFIRNILGVEETIFVHAEGDTRDAIEQMDYYTKGEAWGVFNPNEIRSRLGMAPVEGGEINLIMTPTGAVPLDRMNLYFSLPEQNTDKIPPVATDPPQGESMPKDTVEVATAFPAAKSRSIPLTLQGAIVKITEAPHNESALRQAYSYLVDASESGDPRVINARDSLSKACRTNDTILRQGYIERAQEAVSVFLSPMTIEKSEEKDEQETT